MDPFQTTPTETPAPSSRKKWWLIAGVAVILIVVAVIVVIILTRRPSSQDTNGQQQQKQAASEAFSFSSPNQPMIYAGAPVYDACNLISLPTLKKTIPNFTKLLDTLGTDERASSPVMIEHQYIDRTIASPLGGDSNPRAPGTVISQTPGVVNVDPFISLADSHCTYGQTGDQSLIESSLINNTFAQLYITQRPTPLSMQFLDFLKNQKKFEDHNFKDIDVYPLPEKDQNGYFTAVFVKKDQSAAVIFKTGIDALLDAASDDIAAALSKAPTGPFTVTYPEPYVRLNSPCSLLSADDFSRYTSKPTGAVAKEAILLTEVGSNSARRECERLEIDRDILKSNIASTKVTLRQARTVNDAKQFVTDEKENKFDEIVPLKAKIALGDEAYIKKKQSSRLENPYSFVVRKDAQIVTIEVNLDQPDASSDVFEGRMIPIAQSVLKNLAATD